MEPNAQSQGRPILLYDGECGVCSRFVDFVLAHEVDDSMRFAALESETGQRLRMEAGVSPEIDSVVLLLREKTLTHSDAVAAVLGRMRSPWNLLATVRAVPRPLRDWAYRVFATNRSWFGGGQACRLVTPEERSRFLDLANPSSAAPAEDQSIA